MGEFAPLNKRRLGRTGLDVTELALGGYMFTGEFHVPRSEAGAILDLAFDAGINFVDTAAMYGFGEGEELVARAIARHPGKTMHVSTKVGYLDRSVVRNLGESAYQDPEALRRAIDHSFWIMQRDYIELFVVHEPDWEQWGFNHETGDAVVMSVLDEYKAAGKIGGIGLGGWKCDNIASLLSTGRFDAALVAGGYTLIEQPIIDRVIPVAKKHDIGLILGGVFLQGLLAADQRPRIEEVARTKAWEGRLTEPVVGRIMSIYRLCDAYDMTITEMAIRFILADPDIHTIIAGAQTRRHLRENLDAAAKGPLPVELRDGIRALAPRTSPTRR